MNPSLNWRHWTSMLVSLACFSAVIAICILKKDIAVQIYGHVSYWIILALFLAWVAVVGNALRATSFDCRAFLRRNWIVLLASLVATIVVYHSVPPKFRVLSDETNLVSVSQAMLNHKTAFNNTMQKRFYQMMNPISFELEKRPLMFPFLVHVLHLVRGYTPSNAFLLNGIILFGLLALIGVVAGKSLGPGAGVASVLLTVSYPLVTSVSMSGGFDLLAVFMTGLVFFFLFQYMERPGPDTLALVWIHILVFCHVRYESALYAAIVVISMMILRYFKWSQLAGNFWLYLASPLLLIPLAVQRVLMPNPYENAPDTPAFSWDHFVHFGSQFLNSQIKWDFTQPHAVIINWVAAFVLLFAVIRLISGKTRFTSKVHGHFAAIATLSMVASMVLFFSYYFGNYTHPASVRFFMGISILAAISPLFLNALLPWFTTRKLLLYSLAMFLIYHPTSVQGRFTAIQTLIRETDFAYEFLERYNRPNALVITSRPGQFTALGYGAVTFEFARSNRADLFNELKRHLYTEILVIQRIRYNVGKAVDDELDNEFKLEILEEYQTSSDEYVRISKVRLD